MFDNLKSDGLEESQDRLGGFERFETGTYTGKIKAAYAGKSASSDSQNVTVILALANGKEYRETFWITNKAGENFFLNKQDNSKKVPLPGFTIIEELCLVTTEKPLHAQTIEEKIVNVYDADAGKELPKGVPMLMELLGKEVTFGIVKQTVNKQTKDGNGVYQNVPGETRDENVTDKIFHFPSNLTVPEARQGSKTATFYGAWKQKNDGNTRDKVKNDAGAASGVKAGRPGGPPQANNGAAKTTSLFGA